MYAERTVSTLQVINSDGANAEAVRTVTPEFDISGVSCVCHLSKTFRNVLLTDAKHHRSVLIPLQKAELISNTDQYDSKIHHLSLNFITVEISDVGEDFNLQILKGNRPDLLFEARITKDGCLPYFDDKLESVYRIELADPLEGLFGRARDIMRRYTHVHRDKVRRNAAVSIHRSETQYPMARTVIIHIADEKQINSIKSKELYDKYLSKSGRRSYVYS